MEKADKRSIQGIQEVHRPTNWHLTEIGDGTTWSVGVTESEPGFHPANKEEGTSADSWVAPGEYITSYLEARGEELSDQAIREAILAWRRGDAASFDI